MTPDALREPLSEDAPCGPDLNAGMDPEYDEYYFGALGRLPSFYVQPGVERPDGTRSMDHIFDTGSVDHSAEGKAIDGLLARSRDIRLLVLRAQWEALAGRLKPMAEAIEGIAVLLETFPEDVHPTLADGPADRRDALNDLNQAVTIIQPLQFAGLTGSTEVTLRKLRVAQGQAQPLADETDLQLASLQALMTDASNAKKIETTQGILVTLAQALARITAACKSATPSFTPSIDLLTQTVTDMLDAIANARPDLRVEIEEPAAEPSASDTEDTPTDDAAPAPIAAAPISDVKSHAHARAILEACEAYYRRAEPSSAALLMVTQARLLIGKPLLEALETLLPGEAGKAIVDFGPRTGFALKADKLKQLTSAAPEPAAPDTPTPAVEPINTAAEAAGAIRSVEEYFRAAERSSPVPMLLQRARAYLDKDFQSLVDELIPRTPEE